MKLQTKKFTAHELELQLPYFFKRETGAYFGILSENSSVVVRASEVTRYEMHAPVSQYIGDEESVEVTAEEFTRVFDERMEQFSQLRLKFFAEKPHAPNYTP